MKVSKSYDDFEITFLADKYKRNFMILLHLNSGLF